MSIGTFYAPTTFQRAILSIFFDFSRDTMEIYNDDFTIYGNNYDEALANLEKVLPRCQDHNISLSHGKCFIMMKELSLDILFQQMAFKLI